MSTELKRVQDFTPEDWSDLRDFCRKLGIDATEALDTAVHRHKCPSCGHIWSHSSADAGYACLMAHRGARHLPDPHACSKCGTQSGYRYRGDVLRI